jgi:hypothetical protein
MKNRRLFWLIVLLVGLILLGIWAQNARALDQEQSQVDRHLVSAKETTQTPVASISPTTEETETPEDRTLPPVGSNAILVLGASVLVMIIIGGVMLSSRRRSKH